MERNKLIEKQRSEMRARIAATEADVKKRIEHVLATQKPVLDTMRNVAKKMLNASSTAEMDSLKLQFKTQKEMLRDGESAIVLTSTTYDRSIELWWEKEAMQEWCDYWITGTWFGPSMDGFEEACQRLHSRDKSLDIVAVDRDYKAIIVGLTLEQPLWRSAGGSSTLELSLNQLCEQ